MSRSAPVQALLHPVLLRPGAAYTCHADGLCCTDIHGLGPLTEDERKQIVAIDPQGAFDDETFEDPMLCTEADGGCHFLLPNGYCRIHAERGPEHKPHGCTKFPYGLTATPAGGRVFTHHRCPCRTLGERPPLQVDEALASLRDGAGQLESDADVERVRMSKHRRVSFRAWLEVEQPLLDRLAKGEPARSVLAEPPLSPLDHKTWPEVGREFVRERSGTSFGAALSWFGECLLVLSEGKTPRYPARPWASAFDRAQARSTVEREPVELINDWVADRLWSLEWAVGLGFARFSKEMATRVAIAETIGAHLVREGFRPDRAYAEGVTVVELVGVSDYWDHIVARFPHT